MYILVGCAGFGSDEWAEVTKQLFQTFLSHQLPNEQRFSTEALYTFFYPALKAY
jgi:hypothetical protein